MAAPRDGARITVDTGDVAETVKALAASFETSPETVVRILLRYGVQHAPEAFAEYARAKMPEVRVRNLV